MRSRFVHASAMLFFVFFCIDDVTPVFTCISSVIAAASAAQRRQYHAAYLFND